MTMQAMSYEASLKAAHIERQRRFRAAAARRVPTKPQALQIAPPIARQEPKPVIEWQMQPTTFDAHVVASVSILALIKSGEIEVKSSVRRSIGQIVKEDVLCYFPEFKAHDMKSARRGARQCKIRHYAAYAVFVQRPDLSYPLIGKWFGGRDHTTIIHSVRQVEKEMQRLGMSFNQLVLVAAGIF